MGGRSGGRETKNAKSSAASELVVVIVVPVAVFLFYFVFPSLSGLLFEEVRCKGNTLVGFICFPIPFPSKVKVWIPCPFTHKVEEKDIIVLKKERGGKKKQTYNLIPTFSAGVGEAILQTDITVHVTGHNFRHSKLYLHF